MKMSNRCIMCKHWRGDKVKELAKFKDNPISMDLINGWPMGGDCAISHKWSAIEIYGDATVDFEVDSNFGCVYFEGENDENNL